MSTEDIAESTTVLVVRHGDRWDYAHPEWREQIRAQGRGTYDPSLSPLGHVQARETALRLTQEEEHIDALLVSPYLRTIQTAVPTADLTGLPLCLEEGLAESMHSPDWLPDTRERFFYFPQVDPTYTSLHETVADPQTMNKFTDMPCEPWPQGYITRMLHFSKKLEANYKGKTVACFSHAASIALIAALLGVPTLSELGNFAPCGIFKVVKTGEGPWRLVHTGASNESYVTKNSDTTRPWGFGYDSRNDKLWKSLICETTPEVESEVLQHASAM